MSERDGNVAEELDSLESLLAMSSHIIRLAKGDEFDPMAEIRSASRDVNEMSLALSLMMLAELIRTGKLTADDFRDARGGNR